MTEKITYIADDGTEFKYEDDCRAYEETRAFNPLLENGSVKMWNYHRRPTDDVEEAMYCVVTDIEAAQVLNSICYEHGVYCPCYNERYDELSSGAFWYDERENIWRSMKDLCAFVEDLKSVFGEF